MTLIEVVAGLALLSTLLVSILTAYRTHATQVRSAQDRLAAIDIADELLSKWTLNGVLPAVGKQEALPGGDGLSWRMVAVEATQLRRIGMGTVRLEIFRSAVETDKQVLASVELVVQSSGAPPE